MEKIMESGSGSITRVILTGPESTGKSELTEALADHFKVPFIREYAREYISALKRKYTYEDILHIAGKQVDEMDSYLNKGEKLIFVDTYLIITKVWFDVVFHKIPDWINEEILNTRNDLYLLCKPDIPWVPDPLRENGGDMRIKLYDRYVEELENAGLNFSVVEGIDEERIKNAISKVDQFISQKNS